MKSLRDYVQTVEAEQVQEADRKKIAQPPAGWEPGVAWTGESGTLVSKPVDTPDPQLGTLLEQWGFDPNEYEIVGDLAFRTWEAQTAEGLRQLYSYRATIRRLSSEDDEQDRLDYEDLVAEIKAYKPPKRTAPTGGDAFVVCLADLQIGKADYGGSGIIVRRTLDALADVQQRYRELRKIGRPLGRLYFVTMGDLVENCFGSYDTQTFEVDLDRRDQLKVTRRIIRDALKRYAPDFESIVVSGVPGNHGRNPGPNGRVFTTIGDNDDVSVLENVAEILAENPAFEHIKFYVPRDDLSIVLDVAGTRICFTHGHIAGNGTTPAQKLLDWWKKQSIGNLPPGDADVLVSAHYHHFSAIDHGPRLWLQCPTLDNGSKWWQDKTGARSKPGILTFVSSELGVSDIEVVG